MKRQRAQTSTEYIILVAIVIVIAIVVSSILGDFPGIGGGTSNKVNDYQLSRGNRIGISDYVFSNDSALVRIVNNNYDTLIVDNITILGVLTNDTNSELFGGSTLAFPIALGPGQSVIVNITDSSFDESFNDGSTPDVIINYIDPNTGASYPIDYSTGVVNIRRGSGSIVDSVECNASLSLSEIYDFIIEDGDIATRIITLSNNASNEDRSWSLSLPSFLSSNISNDSLPGNNESKIELTPNSSLTIGEYFGTINITDNTCSYVSSYPVKLTVLDSNRNLKKFRVTWSDNRPTCEGCCCSSVTKICTYPSIPSISYGYTASYNPDTNTYFLYLDGKRQVRLRKVDGTYIPIIGYVSTAIDCAGSTSISPPVQTEPIYPGGTTDYLQVHDLNISVSEDGPTITVSVGFIDKLCCYSGFGGPVDKPWDATITIYPSST